MSRPPLRIVKVGGSLFSRADLRVRLNAWLDNQPAAIHVLIAGGGDLADVIRKWDQLHRLGEVQCHWLCIRLLSVTSSVLAALLGDSTPIRHLNQLQHRISRAEMGERVVLVFDLQDFLATQEPQLVQAVPHEWNVTTDSLAARLAEVLQADEFILLKSAPAPCPLPKLSELAVAGYVDAYFPTIAPRLRKVSFATLD